MKSISAIDSNFAISADALPHDLKFYSIADNPALLFGLLPQDGCLRRMPETVASRVSDGVQELHFHTAGGRVRFCTDSSRVAIMARMNHVYKMPHFAFSGSTGFDLYERIGSQQIFLGAAIPPLDIQDRLEHLWELEGSGLHELTLHFPLYSGVTDLYIGIDEGSVLSPAPDYTYRQPVVYYGSSITQGGCASRPGNAYPNMISMMLDCDHINLGFSGCAKAEDAMVEYICGLDMSVFVYDYDYNAPDPEYLAATHEKMFRAIRAHHPHLPIVMMSLPKCKPSLEHIRLQRFEIIQQTYSHAIAAGDKHVYLLSGADMLGESAQAATVDNCHPNDLGFYLMAQKLAPVIKQLL